MLQQSSSASQVDARRFDGKVALVTGASRGIGRQVCVQLVEEGCRVFGVARSVESLAELNNSFKDSFSGFALDVANAQACREGVKTAWDAFAIVGVLARGWRGDAVSGSDAGGLGRALRDERARSHVSDAGRGETLGREPVSKWAVVNISSVPSGRWAMPHRAAYCVQGALNQLTRCMALELGPLGVGVNAVSPTVTMTDMGRRARADPLNRRRCSDASRWAGSPALRRRRRRPLPPVGRARWCTARTPSTAASRPSERVAPLPSCMVELARVALLVARSRLFWRAFRARRVVSTKSRESGLVDLSQSKYYADGHGSLTGQSASTSSCATVAHSGVILRHTGKDTLSQQFVVCN